MHCVQKPFPDIFCWILPLLSLLNIRDQRAIVLSVIRLTVVFIKNPRPKSHCIVCCLIYGETKAPLYCLLFDLLLSLLNIRDQRAIVLSVVRYTVVFIKYSRPNSHCIVCCLIYDETKEPLYCLLFDLRWDQRAIVLSVVWFTVWLWLWYLQTFLSSNRTVEAIWALTGFINYFHYWRLHLLNNLNL